MYKNADYELLRQKLNTVWREYLKEGITEEKWLKFKTDFRDVIKECAPVREYKDKLIIRKRTNKDLPMNKKL